MIKLFNYLVVCETLDCQPACRSGLSPNRTHNHHTLSNRHNHTPTQQLKGEVGTP